jgi:Ca2+-binding RTX toxin-like protein
MRRTILLVVTMALTLMVASGVALAVTKIGTDGHDNLKGTKGSDTLSGGGGRDRIDGRAGHDVISGGLGSDGYLYGGRGVDVISGGPGHDTLIDGPFREAAVDALSGGGGDDFFWVDNHPAFKDIVSCGSGYDIVSADTKDVVPDDCEKVYLGGIGGVA